MCSQSYGGCGGDEGRGGSERVFPPLPKPCRRRDCPPVIPKREDPTRLDPAEGSVWRVQTPNDLAFPVVAAGGAFSIDDTVTLDADLIVQPPEGQEFPIVVSGTLDLVLTDPVVPVANDDGPLDVVAVLEVTPPPGERFPVEAGGELTVVASEPLPLDVDGTLTIKVNPSDPLVIDIVPDSNVTLVPGSSDPFCAVIENVETEGEKQPLYVEGLTTTVIAPDSCVTVEIKENERLPVNLDGSAVRVADGSCLSLEPKEDLFPVLVAGEVVLTEAFVDLDVIDGKLDVCGTEGLVLTNCLNDKIDLATAPHRRLPFDAELGGPVCVFYRVTIQLTEPAGPDDVLEVWVFWSTTKRTGVVQQDDLIDLQVMLYDNNFDLLFDDVVKTDGVYQPIGGVKRNNANVFFQFDVATKTVQTLVNVRLVAVEPGSVGTVYSIDSFNVPTSLSVTKLQDGVREYQVTEYVGLNEVRRSGEPVDKPLRINVVNDPLPVDVEGKVVIKSPSEDEPLFADLLVDGCVCLRGCKTDPVILDGCVRVDNCDADPLVVRVQGGQRKCVLDATTCNAKNAPFICTEGVKEGDTEGVSIEIEAPPGAPDGEVTCVQRLCWSSSEEDLSSLRFSVRVVSNGQRVICGEYLDQEALGELLGCVTDIPAGDQLDTRLVWDLTKAPGCPIVLACPGVDVVELRIDLVNGTARAAAQIAVAGCLVRCACPVQGRDECACGCPADACGPFCLLTTMSEVCEPLDLLKVDVESGAVAPKASLGDIGCKVVAMATHPCTGEVWALVNEGVGVGDDTKFSLYVVCPEIRLIGAVQKPNEFFGNGITDMSFRSEDQSLVVATRGDLTPQNGIVYFYRLASIQPMTMQALFEYLGSILVQSSIMPGFGLAYADRDTLLVANAAFELIGTPPIHLFAVDLCTMSIVGTTIVILADLTLSLSALSYDRCGKQLYALFSGSPTSKVYRLDADCTPAGEGTRTLVAQINGNVCALAGTPNPGITSACGPESSACNAFGPPPPPPEFPPVLVTLRKDGCCFYLDFDGQGESAVASFAVGVGATDIDPTGLLEDSGGYDAQVLQENDFVEYTFSGAELTTFTLKFDWSTNVGKDVSLDFSVFVNPIGVPLTIDPTGFAFALDECLPVVQVTFSQASCGVSLQFTSQVPVESFQVQLSTGGMIISPGNVLVDDAGYTSMLETNPNNVNTYSFSGGAPPSKTDFEIVFTLDDNKGQLFDIQIMEMKTLDDAPLMPNPEKFMNVSCN